VGAALQIEQERCFLKEDEYKKNAFRFLTRKKMTKEKIKKILEKMKKIKHLVSEDEMRKLEIISTLAQEWGEC
jgi:hypothetical protein